GRTVMARAFPIGIDFEEFTAGAWSETAARAEQRLRISSHHRKILIGVDRLDYSKGLPERLDSYARFLSDNADMANDVTLLQIAPPSREDVGSYQRIREILET